MEKKNKKNGKKTSCQQEPSLSKGKLSAKSRAKKASTKRKPVPRRKSPRENDVMGSQSVENSASLCGTTEGTVSPRRLNRAAAVATTAASPGGRCGFREP